LLRPPGGQTGSGGSDGVARGADHSREWKRLRSDGPWRGVARRAGN
jgi:hypothetical protein